jgi:hypothetical protein
LLRVEILYGGEIVKNEDYEEVILGLLELGIKKGRADLTLPRSLKIENQLNF